MSWNCNVIRSLWYPARPHFYQTRSAWSLDQGSTKKRSAVLNVVPTVTKFCVMWEGLSLPHDTKFGNCRGGSVDRRVIFIWSLIHGSSWSGLIKVGPGVLGCNSWQQFCESKMYFYLLRGRKNWTSVISDIHSMLWMMYSGAFQRKRI